MRLITRREWGAAYAQGSSRIPGPVHGVTLHWEGPHMGDFPHSQCARKVKSIERFHAVSRGWSGIAYNLLVCPHDYVYEGRGAGIRSAANGTSNIGGNDHWYAVCYLGGQGDGFTGQQGMTDAVNYLRSKGAGNKVNGHRDHHPTECPGNEIYSWLKRDIKNTPTTSEEDDMPLTDADIRKIATEVWNEKLGGRKEPAGVLLVRAKDRSVDAARNSVDVDALAAAIVAKLPTAQQIDRATVKAGVLDALKEGTA